MSHAYSEDQLVEQPAIGLFAELGWQTLSAMEEILGSGGTLGRQTKSEVVLTERLRASLVKLNADLPAETIEAAIDEISRDRSAMSLESANREIYQLLKDGQLINIPTENNDCGYAVVSEILKARPDDGIIGEEGANRPSTSGITWVIDPIDGTVNYFYGYPGWNISIAAKDERRLGGQVR